MRSIAAWSSRMHVSAWLKPQRSLVKSQIKEVLLRGRGEPIVAQEVFAAMNASQSKASASPLTSPAGSAARSAES